MASVIDRFAQDPRVEKFLKTLDALVSPGTRATIRKYLTDFSTQRPYLASFLAVLTLFSIPPFLALAAGLGIIVLTSLFWIGLAVSLFLGAVVLSAVFASLCWGYGLSLYLGLKWISQTLHLPNPLPRPDSLDGGASTPKSGRSSPTTAPETPVNGTSRRSSGMKTPRSKITLPSMEASPESEEKKPVVNAERVKIPRRKSASKPQSVYAVANTDGAMDEPDVEDAATREEDGRLVARSVFKPGEGLDKESEREKMMRDIAKSLK